MCKSYNVYVRFEIGFFFSFFAPFTLGASFPEKVRQCRNATVW